MTLKVTQKKFELFIPSVKPEILSNINMLQNILIPFEFDLIEELWKSGPRTTKDIRNEVVLLAVYELGEYEEIKERVMEKISNTPRTKLIAFIDAEARKRNLKFPTYQKIDNALQSLEKLGLVTRRYDSLKNTKYLWLINPVLRERSIKV